MIGLFYLLMIGTNQNSFRWVQEVYGMAIALLFFVIAYHLIRTINKEFPKNELYSVFYGMSSCILYIVGMQAISYSMNNSKINDPIWFVIGSVFYIIGLLVTIFTRIIRLEIDYGFDNKDQD